MSTIKPRTATVVIYQGDDLAALGEAHREAQVAERVADEARDHARRAAASGRSSAARIGDDDETTAQAEEKADEAEARMQEKRDAYQALVADAAERAVEVELRAIGSKRFGALLAAHPPRMVKDGDDGMKVHEDDEVARVNTLTFPEALLRYLDPEDREKRTIVAPEMSAKALGDFLDDEVEFADLERLWQTAYNLNKAMSADPKAVSWMTTRTS